MPSSAHRQKGFTLLEVIVAFAIAASSLGVISQIYAQGSRHLALSRHYSSAVSTAESLLARFGNQRHFQPNTYQDSEGPYDWTVTVTPYGAAPPPSDRDIGFSDEAERRLVLVEITVDVAWETAGRRRNVSLSSLRHGQDI